jgi:hypothetical protein
MNRFVIAVVALLALGGVVRADDPLPAPRIVETAPTFVVGPSLYARRSAYEVWQYYGVDRRGFFRPLVVYSPYGAYYLYDGAPYPWTTTRPREYMPYVVD